MEYIKINKFVLRIEASAFNTFNLYIEGETVKGKPKETIISYGISLQGALKRIAHYESAQADIKGWEELIKWQTEKYESLAKRIDEVGLLLWNKINSDKPAGVSVKQKIENKRLREEQDE